MQLSLKITVIWIIYTVDALKINLYYDRSGSKHTRKRSLIHKLYSSDDTTLYGRISLGTPAQEFNVFLDTTIALSWVPKRGLPHTYTYFPYPGRSSTQLNVPFTIMYYGSFVTGKIVKDHMSIDGTRIGIVPFGLAEDAPPPQEDDEISGALALAKVGEQPDIPTVLDVMVANKAIKTSIFTLYFTCHRDCLPGGPDAQIIFGEVDPKLYNEPIFYVDLVPSFKWQFMLQRLDIGFFTLLQNVLVEIDTKMPAIVGPIEQVQRINTLLGFHDNERGIYAKPCRLVEEQRDLELVFPHFALPTSSEFYMQRYREGGESMCVSPFAFIPYADHPYWILGNAILQDVFTIFDRINGRVGFAARRCLSE